MGSACLTSCEAVAACKSVVFYDKFNYCSHVSTGCTKTTEADGAVSFMKSATTPAPPATTAAAATTTVGLANRGCDYNSNTKITSPGHVTDLKTCTLLCEKSSECRSLTFYSDSKWCTHFSTACSTTRAVKGEFIFIKSATTTAPPATTAAPAT